VAEVGRRKRECSGEMADTISSPFVVRAQDERRIRQSARLRRWNGKFVLELRSVINSRITHHYMLRIVAEGWLPLQAILRGESHEALPQPDVSVCPDALGVRAVRRKRRTHEFHLGCGDRPSGQIDQPED